MLANGFVFHELHHAWKELFVTSGVSNGKVVNFLLILSFNLI